MTRHSHIGLLDSLAELTERLNRSRAALERAVAHSRDVRDGADESGTITVVIDDDGTALDVRVAPDWRRHLAPAQVGAAVVAADGEAAARRATATAHALADTSVHDAPSTTDGSRPSWLLPEPPAGGTATRSLAQLSAAVFAAADDLDRVTQPPPPVDGCGGDGAVRVRMAQGRITGCEVNQAWLARQDEITLAHALREAVCSAAAATMAARAPLVDFRQRLQDVIADARATLARMQPGGTP